jgi:hypothetical protein
LKTRYNQIEQVKKVVDRTSSICCAPKRTIFSAREDHDCHTFDITIYITVTGKKNSKIAYRGKQFDNKSAWDIPVEITELEPPKDRVSDRV